MEYFEKLEQFDFLIVQSLGVLSFIIFFISYQFLKPRHTILIQSLAHIVLAAHIYFLDQIMLMFIAAFASLRDLCSAFVSKNMLNYVLAAFILSLYGLGFYMAQNWVDWCGIIGVTLTTVGQFFRDQFYIYRVCTFIHQFLWLVVYIMIFSLPGVVFISAVLASNVVGILRYKYKESYSFYKTKLRAVA